MTASKVHHTATENSAWDGPAAEAGLPNEASVLKYCHAWYDANGDPTNKSTYKFPHHRKQGGPANLPACRNGLARLSQANIPDSDRAGVEAHLKAHIEDANQANQLSEDLSSRLKFTRPMARLQQRQVDWYSISNQDTGTAEIYIYDEIGYLAISAKDFVNDLNKLKNQNIDVHLNTPGGEVFDGIAIYNALKAHKANVTCYVDGVAASIGSVIAMAGDKVVMAKNAQMMIHDGYGMCVGNSADMKEMMLLLDKTSDNIASIYAEKTSTNPNKWRQMMQDTTWFSADQAVKAGLADEIVGQSDQTNNWDLSIFNASKVVTEQEKAPEPVIEQENNVWDKDLFRRAFEEALKND